MSVRKGIKLLISGLMGKKGHRFFVQSLIALGLIGFISILLLLAFFKGTLDILSLIGSIILVYFIIGNCQQDEKISRLKDRIYQDEKKIDRLIKKENGIDVDKIDRQMEEMQNQ